MPQCRYLMSVRRLILPGLGTLALAASTFVGPVASAQDATGPTATACGLTTGLTTGAAVESRDSSTGTGDAMAASPTTGGEVPTAASSGTADTIASPPAATEMASFDQQFIDMAIPHHATIVSAAGAALIRVEDPELRAVSVDIILDQAVEVDKLRDLRLRLTGSSLPAPVDMSMMSAMPGMAGIDPAELAQQMNPVAFTAQVCDAPEPDIAFIDLTIAHHQVAVMMSQMAIDQAMDPELQALATHSALTQQAQIAELQQIRDRLAAGA